MTAILLALGSSVGYGVSDFLASRVARRVPPVLLVLYSQTLQSVVLLAVVVAVHQPYRPSASSWAPCPPPWSAPLPRGAGAWASTTRPCCGRWPC